MELLRKYGTAADIYFPLIKAGSNNFAVAADFTHSAGDTKISKDGGAAASTTNAPAAITMGSGAMWKLTLTATEMTAAKVAVTIIDAATKAVEDQMIIIATFGNASAQYPFDLSAANVTVGTIGSGVVTAASIAASALNGKGDWNIGKTGYALSQAFPTNFAALSITAGGLVDITQAAADKVWSSASRTLTAFSTALAAAVWDVLEASIATASSIGLKLKTNLDATVSSRLASASYTAPPSAAVNAAAVWDEARAGHVAAGTFGQGVASVQGNVMGSAAGITGAVGSVAGDVGGNVVGSVGSVIGHTPQTGDSFARLGAPAGISIAADIAGIPTAAANADALLDRANGVETGLTPRQCLRLASAALFGKLSGAATTTVAIRDFGDTKNRISATVDADGNRSAVVTDAS